MRRAPPLPRRWRSLWKERTPRLDWAGLLKRTFALDVFACLRCGGRLKGLGVCEGRARSASDTGAPGLAHGRCEPGPSARVNPGRGVLRLTPPQSQKAQSPTAHPMGARPGQSCTSRGCAACPPAWLTARAAPVSGPPRHLRSSPHPQHGLYPAYTLPLADPRRAHVVSVSGLVLFWSPKPDLVPKR